ncbi:MAG: aminoacyl-tRNA hydrolase [Clostridia bacterium]|nr:aminoacyl-tRNA hydrolase [Clostridia bacterium]
MADIFDLFKQISKKEEAPKEPVSFLLVGLGNPGSKYFNTRHNAGFLFLDYASQKANIRIDRSKFHSLCGEGVIGTHRVLLMKPQTMMNASGMAVREAAAFYKIDPAHVIVISDDITQIPGKIRVRKKGSAGGHNGLKDIIYQLASEDFARIRLGVGEKPHPDYDLAAWVLSEFNKQEQEALFGAFGCAYEGLCKLLDGDLDAAQRICNSYSPEEKKA